LRAQVHEMQSDELPLLIDVISLQSSAEHLCLHPHRIQDTLAIIVRLHKLHHSPF
jgi:hypothetical protein